MSDINNKIQDFFTLSVVQDLENESAAAISGGAAVELYNDDNFGKPLVQTNSDSPNVGNDVNDRVTSIVINEGVWRFYTDSQYRGVSADLGVGRYPNIGLGIIPNDSISSFKRVG